MIWRPKMGWRVAVLVVTIALAVAPLTRAQQAMDQVKLQEMMETSTRAASIEANKASFVSELLARFADEASALGYDAYSSKGTRKLMARSGEDLLRLSRQATDFDTFRKLVFDGYTMNTFGQLIQELVFFPVTACRIYDSRSATTAGLIGPMAPGTQRLISVNDGTTGQGGATAPECFAAIPDLDNDPPALALTLTAAGPTGPGNLRTFANGAPVPLAAMLTYTAGTTISTGTVTSSCTACVLELTVRNQGAGNTDVVIDVIGYFHAPFLQPLNTQVVQVSQASTAIGAGWNLAPACPAGTSLTGGGVDTSYTSFFSSTGTMQHFENGPSGNSWSCRGWNSTNNVINNVTCTATCARIPGR